MVKESSKGQPTALPTEKTQKSYEEERREYLHKQNDAFLAKAGPKWNEEELPKPKGEWLQVSSAGRESAAYEDYGTYSINDNKIAYCTKVKGGGGVVFIAPFSVERQNDLIEAGYKASGLGIVSDEVMSLEEKNEWWRKFGK